MKIQKFNIIIIIYRDHGMGMCETRTDSRLGGEGPRGESREKKKSIKTY